MKPKYTKNDHARFLNEARVAGLIDQEAKEIMKNAELVARNGKIKNIGHWLQVTHREVFNRDYELRKQ